MRSPFVFLFLLALVACKKTKNANDNTSTFHKDITVHESVRGSEQTQNTLGFFQLADPSKFIFTASRGIYETEARGFRVVGLNKDGVEWAKTYSLSETYSCQFATCSVMDKNENSWVGGHVFGGGTSYGRPFLVKLNNSGDAVWSKLLVQTSGIEYTLRGVALKALQNSDLAYLTLTSAGFVLYRIATDGQIKWAKAIEHRSSLVFDDPFRLQNNLSSINRMLTETSDGSIFISLNSNYPATGKDVLIKISSNGQLIFARSYSSSTFTCYPSQIISIENDQIVLADQKQAYVSNKPYLYVLSKDGEFISGKEYPVDKGSSNPFSINELNYFNGQLHLSTAQGREFNNYVLNTSLALQSSEKIIGTNITSTDYGGSSLYDKTTSSLFYILDIVGPNAGNGFQYLKTSAAGKSCQQYSTGPEVLTLQSVTPTIKNETDVVLTETGVRQFQDFNWLPGGMPVNSQENACGK